MKHKNIKQDHQTVQPDRLSTVMRADIDQYHSLELTFINGGDTQYRIVNREFSNSK
jgi:hypothetical protein